jgi:accessory gene regulator protein AgrB
MDVVYKKKKKKKSDGRTNKKFIAGNTAKKTDSCVILGKIRCVFIFFFYFFCFYEFSIIIIIIIFSGLINFQLAPGFSTSELRSHSKPSFWSSVKKKLSHTTSL